MIYKLNSIMYNCVYTLYGICSMTTRSHGKIQDLISPEDEAIILEKALIAYQNNRFDQGLNFDSIINEHKPFDKSLYRELNNDNGVKRYVGPTL